ncbi:MAG TPA: diacylglycerol kinase family protein [Gemmatimonadaceae bacterium]|nr:diacylglycerol kinase family protein [Gemmatimonadaceae bacterium]
MPSIALIANPAAGLGLGARRLPAARSALEADGPCAVWVTRGSGDEARCAAEACDRGADTIVALGGDGTWSRVAAVLAERYPDVRFAPMTAGSGNDLAKSLGLPADDYHAMTALARGSGDRRIDAGLVAGRYFFNAAGIGLDVAVVESLARTRLLRGRARYLGAALMPLLTYHGLRASVAFESEPPAVPRELLTVVVCNGRRFGGLIRVAPEALVDDGRLDVVMVDAVAVPRRLSLFAAATRGRHVGKPGVQLRRAERCVVRGDGSPFTYEADGELYAFSGDALEFRCVPQALRVVAPGEGGTTIGNATVVS